jgi:hypothetical protein
LSAAPFINSQFAMVASEMKSLAVGPRLLANIRAA